MSRMSSGSQQSTDLAPSAVAGMFGCTVLKDGNPDHHRILQVRRLRKASEQFQVELSFLLLQDPT